MNLIQTVNFYNYNLLVFNREAYYSNPLSDHPLIKRFYYVLISPKTGTPGWRYREDYKKYQEFKDNMTFKTPEMALQAAKTLVLETDFETFLLSQ